MIVTFLIFCLFLTLSYEKNYLNARAIDEGWTDVGKRNISNDQRMEIKE